MLSSKCVDAGLEPYVPRPEKPWNARRAHHLYNRLCNGATYNQIQVARANTPERMIDLLFQSAGYRSNNIDFTRDFKYKVDRNYEGNNASERNREKNFSYYFVNQVFLDKMVKEGFKSKLAFFWLNHFVAETRNHAYQTAYIYQYFKVLYDYALGDFKMFVKEMGITPAMLYYLNGNVNNKYRPNENYARELLELFTMGEGNYTQKDITEIARALTGWRASTYQGGNEDPYPDQLYSYEERFNSQNFTKNYHDYNAKSFLGGYINGYTKVNNNNFDKERAEYDAVHNIIFSRRADEIARFICAKLYRYYVYQDAPTEIVNGLAAEFKKKWNIEDTLSLLFKSEHFFEEEIMGAHIKSPIESLVYFMRSTGLKRGDENTVGDYYFYDEDGKYEGGANNPNNRRALYQLWILGRAIGQDIQNPVNVAGWPGYRSWINEFTLVNRWDYSNRSIVNDLIYPVTGDKYIQLLKDLSGNSSDPEVIVRAVLAHYINIELEDQLQESCVDVFKARVPSNYFDDGTWTLDYNRTVVIDQFKDLMQFIFTIPEYQLM